ncbi:MAG: metallopeptidase family protein [Gemmatimonadales bacterium]
MRISSNPQSAIGNPQLGGVAVREDDFRHLVQRLLKEVPASYLDGVVDVAVSPKSVPHPLRADIYTLGECIPLEWSGSGADLQSRIVLYHGSFAALAKLGDLDWREETWETLTHELRHHLEWQANLAGLEAYDWAAEQNFARADGEPFDPVFYRSGEGLAPGVYKVDDDVFLEGDSDRVTGECYELVWHGRRYRAAVPPAERRAWRFLTLDQLDEPPPGEAVLVLPGRTPALAALRQPVSPVSHTVTVERLDE